MKALNTKKHPHKTEAYMNKFGGSLYINLGVRFHQALAIEI